MDDFFPHELQISPPLPPSEISQHVFILDCGVRWANWFEQINGSYQIAPQSSTESSADVYYALSGTLNDGNVGPPVYLPGNGSSDSLVSKFIEENNLTSAHVPSVFDA